MEFFWGETGERGWRERRGGGVRRCARAVYSHSRGPSFPPVGSGSAVSARCGVRSWNVGEGVYFFARIKDTRRGGHRGETEHVDTGKQNRRASVNAVTCGRETEGSTKRCTH